MPLSEPTITQEEGITPFGTAPAEFKRSEPAQAGDQPIPTLPVAAWAQNPPCTGPAECGGLVILQAGSPARMSLSANGLRAVAAEEALKKPDRWIMDTGTASPDGQWLAFTSLGNESGGPVFLENVENGEPVNLIAEINAHLPKGQPELVEDFWWDVIGWFPDSQRLLIGPEDMSMVVVVDRTVYTAQVLKIPSGGRGGRMFVNLAPDGSGFLFVGEDEAGQQNLTFYNLKTGIHLLQPMPYEQGLVSNPRFSPDGTLLAYRMQKGSPDTGIHYSLDLVLMGKDSLGKPRTLAEGNLSMTSPIWSPDGQSIAFTRDDSNTLQTFTQDAPAPQPPRGNLWVVSIADGQQTQLTFLDGLARSPVWAKNGQALAFVTQDGEVDMASTAQPGQVWQVSGPMPEVSELSSVFFIP